MPIKRKKAVTTGDVWVESTKDATLVQSGQAFKPEDLLAFVRLAEDGDTRFLHAFYDEMRARDAHLDCELSKAEDYLTGARIDVLPYPPRLRSRLASGKRSAKRALECANYIEEQIFSPSIRMDRVIAGLADGLWKGVGGMAVEVGPPNRFSNGRERLIALEQIPSQRFRYLQNTTTLALQQTEDEYNLTPVDDLGDAVIILEADREVASPARRGLIRKCLGLWLIRSYGPQWWVRFVELFGSPLRMGRYTPGDADMEARVVKALKSMGTAGWAALPEGASMEFIEANARSTGNPPHELLLDWAAREISKVILGATQTADVQRNTGSRASAQVHHDVTLARSMTRASLISHIIRQKLFRPLISRNFSEDDADLYTPELRIRVESKPDIYNFAQAMKMLADAGMETIPLSYIHDAAGIPIPDGDEPCLTLPLVPGDPRALQDKPEAGPGDAATPPSKVPPVKKKTTPEEPSAPAPEDDEEDAE